VDQNAKEYVALIAEGRFRESLEVIRRTNPFPSVCGRVCTHPCEIECVRSASGGAVAVRWLKRFVADLAAEEGFHPTTAFEPSRPERVAVVGGGPCGLTAALDLVSLGYPVEVIEARDEPGGLMRWGIPDFRLPRRLVRGETRAVEGAGVTIRTAYRLGRDGDLDGLMAEGFSTVLLAAGAGKQAGLGIPGADGRGVVDTLSFMEAGAAELARERVVVVGATREGFDAARLAARLGARSVALVTHLRDETVDGSAVEAARKDGVRIHWGLRPVAVRRRRGRAEALVVERVAPKAKSGTIPATVILPAMDRYVDPDLFAACRGVERGPFGILADPITCETARRSVFAAGDAVTGPRTVIEAIAAGHRAAAAIHLDLSAEQKRFAGRPPAPGAGPDAFEITSVSHQASHRIHPLSGPAAAMSEARRCLRCGLCLDCETCHPDCPTRVAMLVRPGSRSPSWSDPLVKVDLEEAGILAGDRTILARDAELRPLVPVPRVDPLRCIGCGRCADACPYDVVQIVLGADGGGLARIHEHACRACGSCVGACPVDAVDQPYWSSEALERAVDRRGPGVTLSCRWSTDGPDSSVPLPCAGRAGERLLVHAVAAGSDTTQVRDCGADCRYRTGFTHGLGAGRRVRTLLGRLGLDPLRAAPATGNGPSAGASHPFARPLLQVDRWLSQAEVVPSGRVPDGAGLRTAVRGEVLLYSGCLPFVDALVEEDGGAPLIEGLGAAIRLLNRAGVVPALAEDERTCGIDLRAAGDAQAFRKLAQLNAEAFERAGARTIVATCSEAVHALCLQAEALGSRAPWKAVHLAVFLDDLGVTPLPLAHDGPVALCDDPADRDVRAAAGRLVRAAGGRLVRWKPPRSSAKRPHGSPGRSAALELLGRAGASGASVVVCTSLRRSLGARYALRSGGWDAFGVRVVDLATLLAGGER
jgi:NADPH-dependent glutamate synthase beta subunit-like oxidoreductase/ferredoxin